MLAWFAQSQPDIDWRSIGVVGALFVGIIVMGAKRWWMFTWVHRTIVEQYEARIADCEREREMERAARKEWQTIALTQAGVLEHAVQTVTETVRTVSPHVEGPDVPT